MSTPLTPVTDAPYAGMVNIGRPIAGATVVAQTLDGDEIARTTSGASGSFLLRGVNQPRFRVVVSAIGFEEELAAEVDSLPADKRYIVVNVPTTIVSRYLQANSGESVESANSRFRALAGLPEDLNLGYGVEESPRNPFSHLSFFRQASNAGGIETFIGQLVSEMGAAGQKIGVDLNARFRLSPTDMQAAFNGLSPELVELLRLLQGDRTLVLGVVSTGAKDILGFVGKEAASSVVDAGVDTGWTKFAEQVGFNFGTTVALNNIEQELTEVLNDLTDIENELSDQDYQSDFNALAPDVAFIEALSSDGDGTGTLTGGIAEPYGVTQTLNSFLNSTPNQAPTNQPASQPAVVSDFISALLGFDMAQSATAIADKQQSMNNLWRKNKVDTVINTSVEPRFANFPVRSNYWVDVALGNYNYYSAFQQIAANWVVEIARQNNQLGDAINGVLPTVQSIAAALRRQRGQFPYYQISDNLLVDLNAGLIWSLEAQGPSTYADAVSFASSYTVQGTGPTGATVTLGGFRVPTFNEYMYLMDRARFCTASIPSNDTAAPVNSDDGVGDYGRVTQGLQRLGFENVNTVFTSSSNGGSAHDGGVWYRHWRTPWDDTYEYRLSKYTEMELNHESGKAKFKKDDDKRPFLMCRQIFNVINDPNGPGGDGSNAEFYSGTPSELLKQDPAFDFYPSWGVPTGITGGGAFTFEKYGTGIIFGIYTGQTATMGSDYQRTAGENEQFFALTHNTYNSGEYDGTQEFVWFDTNNDQNLTISNYPPAYPADDENGNPLSYLDAINVFGTAGSLLWQTSDSNTAFQVEVNSNITGYDGTNFPATLTAVGTLTQEAVNDAGEPRQPNALQVSPRNRIYDNSFSGTTASERYGATLFFDNETLEGVTNDVVWELINLTNTGTTTPYTGGGFDLSNVSGDEGLLQINLSSIPTTGVDFEVRATITVGSQPFTNTVSGRAVGIP